MNDTVLLTRDGPVATLTLNRPDALNALDYAMVDALVARTAEVAADDALRVVVLRGAGRHFMAGGDIRTFAGELSAAPRPASGRLHPDGRADARRHRGAAPDAASGRRPGARRRGRFRAVAGQRLRPGRRQRRRVFRLGVPAHRADPRRRRFVVAAAHRRPAERDGDHAARRALRRGGPRGTSGSSTGGARRGTRQRRRGHRRFARAGPAFALRSAKRLVRESLSRTLSEQLQAEAVSFGRCTAQPDFTEGITAFLEKRAPKFGAG